MAQKGSPWPGWFRDVAAVLSVLALLIGGISMVGQGAFSAAPRMTQAEAAPVVPSSTPAGAPESVAAGGGVRHMEFITMPVLIVIYPNGRMIPAHIERIQQQLAGMRLWYWINSYLSWNLELHYLLLDTPVPSGWFIGPDQTERSIERGLAARGEKLTDYVGLLVFGAQGDWSDDQPDPSVRYLRQGLGGGTYGVPAPWPNGAYRNVGYSYVELPPQADVTWVALHEFHHQVDSLHHASGHPEYGHADQPIVWPGRFGEHYDFNVAIARALPRADWLDCQFGRRERAIDADGDGVPDDDPRVPLDERRFGSDPARRDSTGQGGDWSDLKQLLTSSWVPGRRGLDEVGSDQIPAVDPGAADLDGDGLPNATDPYPLYPICPDVPYGSVTIDGEPPVSPSEWHHFASLRDRLIQGEIYLQWDERNLYLAFQLSRFAIVRIRVDANNDGWFHGADNYEIQAVPFGIGGLGMTKAFLLNNADPEHGYRKDTSLVSAGDIDTGFTKAQDGSIWMEVAIPANSRAGLQLRPGQAMGVSFAFQVPGMGVPWVTLFEPHAFVSLSLLRAGDGTASAAAVHTR